MIKQHSGKHGAGTYRKMAMTVQGDGDGEIRNGLPEPRYYKPRGLSPEQQARLSALISAGNTDAEEDASTEERSTTHDEQPAS